MPFSWRLAQAPANPLLCRVLWSHTLNQTIVIFQLISLTCPQEQPALVLHSVQHYGISPCGPKAKKTPEHSSLPPQLSPILVSTACCYVCPLIEACFLLQIMANLSSQEASQTFFCIFFHRQMKHPEDSKNKFPFLGISRIPRGIHVAANARTPGSRTLVPLPGPLQLGA